MNETHRIVVEDPSNRYWEGSLVDQSKARVIESRGGMTLPCNPELFDLAGVGGYHRRSWGAGWPLDSRASRRVCPLNLYLDRDTQRVHFAVRLVPEVSEAQRAADGESFVGQLRLIGDSSGHAHHVAVSPDDAPIDMRSLGRADKRGGWTLRSSAIARPSIDGVFGFALYGTAPGLRVAWAAITST